jgi:hypothetical protein
LSGLFFDRIRTAEINTVRQADIISAGRDQSAIDPMMAKIALLSDTVIIVKIDGIIGTGFDA